MAKAGKRVPVTVRGELVAYLVPAEEPTSILDRLEAAGQLRRGRGNLMAHMPPPPAPPGTAPLSQILQEMRARRSTVRVDAALLPRTDLLLGEVTQVDLSPAVLESASRMPDPRLRTLDAIHLATALLVREELDVLLTYDERLLAAAAAHGIPTAAPA
jgi:uncharacterized protein